MIRSMNTYRDSRKKGTVTIDAAIGLPVFLLAMGLLLCLMLQLEAEERRFCELRDRALTDMEIRGAVSRLSRGNLVVEGVRELKSRVRLKLPSLSAQKKTDAPRTIPGSTSFPKEDRGIISGAA